MNREFLGRLFGYLVVGILAFVFSYLAMAFLAWDLDITQWSEFRRGITGAWTVTLLALFIFETRK